MEQVVVVNFFRIRAEIDSPFGLDAFDNFLHGTEIARAVVERFSVLRETRHGFWIYPSWAGQYGLNPEKHKRWVSKTSRKRYAYPTIEEAVESFRHRCACRIAHAERNIQDAKAVYELSKEQDPISHYGKVVER